MYLNVEVHRIARRDKTAFLSDQCKEIEENNRMGKIRDLFKKLEIQGISFDRVPEELWVELCDILQEAGIKTIPKKNKCKKAKWLSEEALQIAVKRREAKGKGEKERYTHLNAEFQRVARRGKKPSSAINAKK